MTDLLKPGLGRTVTARPASPTDSADRSDQADSLRTLRDVAAVFVRAGSARLAVGAAVIATVARIWLGDVAAIDAVLIALVVVLVGPVEWIIHTVLLHAPVDSFRSRRLDTSSAHRHHHEHPNLISSLLLDPVQAALFLPMIAANTALWALPVAWLFDSGLLGSTLAGSGLLAPYLTGLAASWWGLAHYEWVHLLVHTRYRPRSRYYKRLARNHRLHHYRNEDHWLGVTSNLGDRLFGTLPASKSDVPLSDTARNLA